MRFNQAEHLVKFASFQVITRPVTGNDMTPTYKVGLQHNGTRATVTGAVALQFGDDADAGSGDRGLQFGETATVQCGSFD